MGRGVLDRIAGEVFTPTSHPTPPMSAMIKALSKQLDVRLPFSRTTLLVAALWACAFASFVTLGLSR